MLRFHAFAALSFAVVGCRSEPERTPPVAVSERAADLDRAGERERMVTQSIAARGVSDPAVLEAMRRVK
jgi:hypothetical protein